MSNKCAAEIWLLNITSSFDKDELSIKKTSLIDKYLSRGCTCSERVLACMCDVLGLILSITKQKQ